jgi:hypothetical protein
MFRSVVWAADLATSAGIILASKQLLTTFGYPVFLTAFHSLLRWVFFLFVRRPDTIDSPATIGLFSRWLLGLLSVAAMAATLISLKLNSVFLYEAAIILVLPCICLTRFLSSWHRTSVTTVLALILGFAGFFLIEVNDPQFTFTGLAVAFASVAAVHISRTQIEDAVPRTQIEAVFCQPRFVLAIAAFLAIEGFGSRGIFAHEFQVSEIGLIVLVGVLVIAQNWTAHTLDGYVDATPAVNYAKAACVFASAIVAFREPGETTGNIFQKALGAAVVVVSEALFLVFERRNEEVEQRAKVTVLEEEDQIEPPVLLHVKGVVFQKAETDHEE